MTTLKEKVTAFCENMSPGSSVPYTVEYKRAWSMRVAYEEGYKQAIEDAGKIAMAHQHLSLEEVPGWVASKSIETYIRALLTDEKGKS